MSLQSKVALVTGSDSGIGQAIVVALARQGADVAINYNSDDEGANRTRDQVESAGQKALLVKADLRDPEVIPTMFEKVHSELGAVDILVNNAGTGGGGG